MLHGRRAMLPVALLLVAACSVSVKRGGGATAPTPADLMAADRAFAADVARDGMAAWLRWFEPAGVQVVPGRIVRGDSARRALMGGLLEDPKLKLIWAPDTAIVAASGDIGYTIGRSQVRQTNADGTSIVRSSGRYVTIWRRQPDGSWKVELDTGNTDPEPQP